MNRGIRSSWSTRGTSIKDNAVIGDGGLRTKQRVADHNQEILHCVHPDQFLQQLEIQGCIGRAIGDQDALNFCRRLPIYSFDEGEFFRCH